MESEIAYLEKALKRYRRLKSVVTDPRALQALEELILEAKARIEELARRH